MYTVVNCNSARRRGGRVAECGGLLNRPRSYRFNLLNNLQMGAKVPKWVELI
jgi:hypothetical protein